jgi:hypothetical protein
LAVSGTFARSADAAISFSQQIRPILSENCFKCHGTDDATRKAKMRLDDRDVALRPAKSGAVPIVPGKPEQSELVKRISSDDPDEVMPPASTKKTLTAQQKTILREWIAEGAKYERHWAFVAPAPSPAPETRQRDWAKSPIDQFVLARLEKEGLRPNPPADRYTLARRVSLDLTGLPPTPEEADAFVNDTSPDAYEKLVNRLLGSPAYGERWARRWLDLARYADSNGYEKDRPRSIWPYRDWVIDAFNQDLPYDQFTIKQLAGDMLPQATLQDRIATGFHRNTMLNEEGGIDPLEFRFYSMVDRAATTGTAWLGLTIGCAQCHSHKYDPISHREYYSFMAFLNNTDEPEIPVPSPEIAAKRAAAEKVIQEMEDSLATKFPIEETRWSKPDAGASAASGGKVEKLDDGSFRFSGADKDTYYFRFTNAAAMTIRFIRLEALADDSLPGKGPGLRANGNFVGRIKLLKSSPDAPDQTNEVKLVNAKADYSQNGFSAESALGNDPQKGWAVDPKFGQDHWASFELEKLVTAPPGTRWEVRVDQQYGDKHVLGRARISVGEPIEDPRPKETRRKDLLDQKFAAWERDESEKAIHWTPLHPVEAKSNEPILTTLGDNSVLASGDQTKSDTYEVKYRPAVSHITAIRLEALPDASLPGRGPGRTFYEGTTGDFLLCEFSATAGGKPLKFKSGTLDKPGASAEATFDGNPLTGWTISDGIGKPHAAVYVLDEPLESATELDIKMLFERYFASDLGRFRISVTSDDKPAEARGLPGEVEAVATKPASERTAAENKALYRQFLETLPELADARRQIQKKREAVPQYSTTLVMNERPATHPRKTRVHHRGEFLSVEDEVAPGVPAFLPPLPQGTPPNRLAFARWLVSTNNPLTARVAVNRQWQAFFGRGIVRTLDDFGYQGAAPSNQELLDWLAVEFMKEGWSFKKLDRLIVTSAVYQQSSAETAALAERDPENILLARGPRFRVEAEIVRDSALRASGLLSAKMGGPSVFPPQPAGVTTEGAYRAFTWNTSSGEDRYRRSLYTFTKRTTPFAMYNTFDAPSGETCVARREVSNTPLQALALLNDICMIEATQALGKHIASETGDDAQKLQSLFRRCLTRPPTPEEQTSLLAFYQRQKQRIGSKELDAAKLAGNDNAQSPDVAAWTTVARAALNLDEAVTKE